MAKTAAPAKADLKELDRDLQVACRKAHPRCELLAREIRHLSDYFSLIGNFAFAPNVTFWFRGHGDMSWRLTPSALRYGAAEAQRQAIGLLRDFKRIAASKIEHPPALEDELQWAQLARHHGLPTPLLDWTENAAIALYFACEEVDANGLVFVMNPAELNKESRGEGEERILDAFEDAEPIRRVLASASRGKGRATTIAVNPVHNTERIVAQRGTFTIHASPSFPTTRRPKFFFVCVPVLKKHKGTLLRELERIGVDEMSVYPELEHICGHLKKRLPTAT